MTRRTVRGLGRLVTGLGSATAVVLTAHSVVNLRLLRRPAQEPAEVDEAVSVLIPARDEEGLIAACVRAALDQQGILDLEVMVLDDGSTDATVARAKAAAGADARLRVLTGSSPPPGWLGKPHACRQLAEAARGAVLVFVDADVVLAPHAVASSVGLLREHRLDLVSPYPRQVAESISERLVQPLLQWSWLTTLPLRWAERSARPSLSAANGQLLVVDAAAYGRAGGHAAVRGEVLDDVALLRALKRAGGRGVAADGTHLATCRMYRGWSEVRAGYTKSLWSAFGSPAGAACAIGLLGLAYVVPPVAALHGSRVGVLGYAAAVAGRYLVAERTGGRSMPDALAHPASILLLGWLTADSWRAHRSGRLRWKGRPLPTVRTP